MKAAPDGQARNVGRLKAEAEILASADAADAFRPGRRRVSVVGFPGGVTAVGVGQLGRCVGLDFVARKRALRIRIIVGIIIVVVIVIAVIIVIIIS